MESVDAAAFHVSWVVTLEISGIENEPKLAVFEDAISVGAITEHPAALPLREDTVLLALVGLAGFVAQGGAQSHLDEKEEQQKHCVLLVLLECGASCKAPP